MPKKYTLLDTFSLDGFYCTQGYGLRPEYYKQFGILYHEGVDFGHKNKKIIVRSPISGKVILDEDFGRQPYGNNVKVWDDKQLCVVQFCHLEYKNFVSMGQIIKAGDPIGEMGTTGNSSGEHLHLNFIPTDKSGNRLYPARSQNLGYCDPQHPLDPNPPKYAPGVEKYEVEWLKSLETSTSETPTNSEKTYLESDMAAERERADKHYKLYQEAKADYEQQKTITEEKTKELTTFISTLATKLVVIEDKAQIIGAVERLLEVENQKQAIEKEKIQLEKKYLLEKEELSAQIATLRKEIEQQNNEMSEIQKRHTNELDREKKQNETLLSRVNEMEQKMSGVTTETTSRFLKTIKSLLERIQ